MLGGQVWGENNDMINEKQYDKINGITLLYLPLNRKVVKQAK